MEAYAHWVWLAAYLCSLLCGSAAGLACFYHKESRNRKSRFAVSAFLLLLSVTALVWNSACLYELANPHCYESPESYALALQKRLVELPDSFATTDRGHRIPQFRLRQCDESNVWLTQRLVPEAISSLVTLIAPPDVRSNCHGWVFAGGKTVLRGPVVDTILTDNGYQQVNEPRAGDLIVYRDTDGTPSHTGVVKAASRDGVLIESKWGFGGRYLHEPQHQCYSQAFAYYRSSRAGHALRIESHRFATRT
jgi:hypothetical protein